MQSNTIALLFSLFPHWHSLEGRSSLEDQTILPFFFVSVSSVETFYLKGEDIFPSFDIEVALLIYFKKNLFILGK